MSASLWTTPRRLGMLAMLSGLLLIHAPASAAKKHHTEINWKPAINLEGDLLLPDAQTPATVWTAQGPTPWSLSAAAPTPIPQGDKLRLNVFVATGGASLSEVKVRLDNIQIADLTAAPWNTVIDTAKLTPGAHMIDVWAQATGNPPQDSSLEKGFTVIGPAAASPMFPPPTVPQGPPSPPVVVPDTATDTQAKVALFYHQGDPTQADIPLTAANDVVSVTQPTQIKVRLVTAPGNDAAYYVYAITTDGVTIQQAPEQYALLSATHATDTNIQVQPQARTPAAVQAQSQTPGQIPPGLPPGQYTLWVWPVNGAGHPGAPVEAILQIP